MSIVAVLVLRDQCERAQSTNLGDDQGSWVVEFCGRTHQLRLSCLVLSLF